MGNGEWIIKGTRKCLGGIEMFIIFVVVVVSRVYKYV